MTDEQVVVANLTKGTKTFPKGRKVFITYMTGWPGSVEVRAQSRGGRWVTAWIGIKLLENARIKNLPKDSVICTKFFIGYHGRDADLACKIVNEGL